MPSSVHELCFQHGALTKIDFLSVDNSNIFIHENFITGEEAGNYDYTVIAEKMTQEPFQPIFLC